MEKLILHWYLCEKMDSLLLLIKSIIELYNHIPVVILIEIHVVYTCTELYNQKIQTGPEI